MPAQLDPVTLEVIRNALPAIANEMAVDLQRTSYGHCLLPREFLNVPSQPGAGRPVT